MLLDETEKTYEVVLPKENWMWIRSSLRAKGLQEIRYSVEMWLLKI